MEQKHKEILLFSGGLDSYIAYHFLNRPQTLYFNTHNRYWQQEIRAVTDLIPSTIIDTSLELSDRETGENAYIPARNLLFSIQAMKYSDTIIIAGLRDDNVSDKNALIFEKWSRLLSGMEGRPIQVWSPFFLQSKSEIVAWFKRVHPELVYDLAHRTMSCYSNSEYYCGMCPACFRKWCALTVNKIPFLQFYNVKLASDYYKKALENHYDPQRNRDIIFAIEETNWFRKPDNERE
jgi:hypothetical protein